jgi:VanZ family protein
MLPLQHRGLWQAASAMLVVAVIWGSLQTGVDLPLPSGADKAEHFGVYLFLAVWFTGLYPRSRYIVVAACLVGLGLAMEIGQYLMATGRTADPRDVVANTLGVGLGLLIAWRATGGWTPRVEGWLGRN